jgi:hypothetical protein
VRQLLTRRAGHGRPGEVHDVEGDDRALQQPQTRLGLLHAREDGHHRDDHAQDQVERDEELVQSAVVRLATANNVSFIGFVGLPMLKLTTLSIESLAVWL